MKKFNKSKITRVSDDEKTDWYELGLSNKPKNKADSCFLCNKKINAMTGFYCKYCKEHFCDRHRLPENHRCLNPKKPDLYRRGFGSKTWYK